MEKFVVSARKYRPSDFDEVVGQSGVTQTLQKAVNSQHLGHSFLFCGPRGVGKTTCARILAKIINKQSESDERDYSINIFELDAASNNSVDDIKMLIDQVRIPPQIGDYKVYIIDEVHMLSQSAFNAFLKTLEEPPAYAIFILATTEKHKILPTILSRCQIYDFKRISVKDIVAHLANICKQEGIEFEENALNMIAQKADGALRDALSMFDRLVDRSEQRISFESVITNLNILDHEYYFRVTDLLMAQDLPEALLLFDEVLGLGFDGEEFISGLSEHFRNLMVTKEAKTKDLLEAGKDLSLRYQQQAQLIPNAFLLNALDLANDCQIKYRAARNKRLQVELALMKIAHLPGILNPEALKKKPLKPEQKSKTENNHTQTSKEVPKVAEPEVPLEKEKPKPEISTKKESAEAQEKTAENTEKKSEKKAPKTTEKKLSGDTASTKSNGLNTGINLSRLKNRDFDTSEEAKQKEEAEENSVLDPEIDETQLKEAWEALRADFKKNDSVFFPILEHSEVRLTEKEVFLIFDTQGSKELFLSRSEEVLTKFFKYLGSKVPVKSIVEKSVENNAPKKVFTSKDKWEFLQEKNPDLQILKEKLQLYLKD
ncbi:MAG: DNA polymerase III subunit gamma/tau [Chitinophagales bacterium]